MCYVGLLKDSMYLVNARLDLRNAANSLQIQGKGCYLGTHAHGGVGTRNTRPYIIIKCELKPKNGYEVKIKTSTLTIEHEGRISTERTARKRQSHDLNMNQLQLAVNTNMMMNS